MRLCEVEGCSKRHHAHGFCNTHYKCFKRTDNPTPRHPPARLCKVDGCGRRHHGLGYCGMHHLRFRKTGEAGGPESRYQPERGCSVGGCSSRHYGNGLCSRHSQQVSRHGVVQPDRPDPPTAPEGFKWCSKCSEMKSLEEFSHGAQNQDGLQLRCKECNKQYRTENREKILAQLREYGARPEVRELKLKYNREYGASLAGALAQSRSNHKRALKRIESRLEML